MALHALLFSQSNYLILVLTKLLDFHINNTLESFIRSGPGVLPPPQFPGSMIWRLESSCCSKETGGGGIFRLSKRSQVFLFSKSGIRWSPNEYFILSGAATRMKRERETERWEGEIERGGTCSVRLLVHFRRWRTTMRNKISLGLKKIILNRSWDNFVCAFFSPSPFLTT